MNRDVQTSRIGRVVGFGSAGLFAAAFGYSALLVSAAPVASAAAAAVAFLGARWTVARVDTPAFVLPAFELVEFTVTEPEELLLTEFAELLLTDVVDEMTEELVLRDRLEPPASDSRVIRLFDARELTDACDVNGSLERRCGTSTTFYPDATQELHSALAALRGSLVSR